MRPDPQKPAPRTSSPHPSWCTTTIVCGPEAEAYDFGEHHPLRPERYRRTFALMQGLGLLDIEGVRVQAPRRARVSELLTAHSYPYIQAVRRAQALAEGRERPADLTYYGLGTGDNPIFPGMYEAGALAAGASLEAMEAVLDGRSLHAHNMGGGLHHAAWGAASGFCIFNDVVVAIRRALERAARVAYVDLDAHHGDGVQDAFYDDPRVLTLSVHESGRFLFPGTGGLDERGSKHADGTTVNVPLAPRSGDEAYAAIMEGIVEPAVAAFEPDVLVTQTGCDNHWRDPLSHLGATLSLFPALGEQLHDLAHRHTGGRWVLLGGGGYDPTDITPRAWTALLAGAVHGARIAHRIPEQWRSEGKPGHPAIPKGLCDDPGPDFEPRGAESVLHLIDDFQRHGIRRLRPA